MASISQEWVIKAEGDATTALRADTQLFTQYAVQFRYPGESAEKEEAKEAISAMKRCKIEFRSAF